MDTKISSLPNWKFSIDEVSAGVYKLIGRHNLGSSIELTGVDTDDLVANAITSAEKMEEEIRKKTTCKK